MSSNQRSSGQKRWKIRYNGVFGVDNENPNYSVILIDSNAPGNIFWPGEQPAFTFQIVNHRDEPLAAAGLAQVLRYESRGIPGDIWQPRLHRVADVQAIPINVDLDAGGFVNLQLAPQLPETFGGYAVVIDLGDYGRQFGATLVRAVKAVSTSLQYPGMSLDPLPPPVMHRLGVQAVRYGIPFMRPGSPRYDETMERIRQMLTDYHKNNVTVLLMFGATYDVDDAGQPLDRMRPHLDDEGVMKSGKMDHAWLPEYDPVFTEYVADLAREWGWPNGPVTAVQLWNEPWEGLSISGWQADIPRYRAIYTAMAKGVETARADAGVDVLIGGCDSSSNTWDKLFADGDLAFLKWLDVCTIHYQGLDAPSTYRAWREREHPNGRVRIWDTESWVANTDDRIAVVIAANRAAGYDRCLGVYAGNVATPCRRNLSNPMRICTDNGIQEVLPLTHAWPQAAAVAASQYFIGTRPFRSFLFQNGLPWVMVFDGLENPEDGTVVVVGDLSDAFPLDELPFRRARSLAEIKHKEVLRQKLQGLPDDDPGRAELQVEINAWQVLTDCAMTIDNADGRFALYDFYGNPQAADGTITIPLDHRGFILRGDGSAGAFAALLDALRRAEIRGIAPLDIIARDMTAPIEQHPDLRLELTNVLNRPVRGTLQVAVEGLQTETPATLEFAPHETREVLVNVAGGAPAPDNTYPLTVRFDAGDDGIAVHREDMHVNVIVPRRIQVDGKLDDWDGVPPQYVGSVAGAGPALTEAAWLPFVEEHNDTASTGGAIGYLAYDEDNFYFAARIADDTPHPGTLRFAARDDDEFYYPETAYSPEGEALHWPERVRRYSYRKWPALPSSYPNGPIDNVQIAFNVLPADHKPQRIAAAPGTMPHFGGYDCTDYEFALNQVAERYGGGTEIWRLLTPGMPRKHFYPRQPASPFDGAVDGRLAIHHDGNTRIVECAIPWSEIPLVKERRDAGQPIKFSFRVNDDSRRDTMELARDRSASMINAHAFHVDWETHWANEIEFGWDAAGAGTTRTAVQISRLS